MANFTLKLIASCSILACAGGVFALEEPARHPRNVVQLAAQGAVEVTHDWLSVTLSTTRDGADAAAVQSQLKIALDSALSQAQPLAQAGQLDVRSGNFSVYPRRGRDGKLVGWQGSADLTLQGRDFARIGTVIGSIQTLGIAQMNFSLSREQRDLVRVQAQSQAIEQFKTRAQEIASSFGFTGYNLRDIQISANDQDYVARPRVMAMQAKSGAVNDEPLPLEAGKTTVQVTVAGFVQLQ